MQSQTWLILGIALATALLINTVNVCAAGICDTEDFYPTYHVHSKFNSTSNGNVIDTIVSLYYWTKKSKYFAEGYYFSFDYYRTVSCSDGADKDVYDYIRGSLNTNLPLPHREDVEESNPWNPVCWISPRLCNEEVELGTKNPKDIQTFKWYYVRSSYVVKAGGESYAMRIEPEVEPATTITPPPWEEWCLLACYETKVGSNGW